MFIFNSLIHSRTASVVSIWYLFCKLESVGKFNVILLTRGVLELQLIPSQNINLIIAVNSPVFLFSHVCCLDRHGQMHNIFGLVKLTLKRICQVSMCLYLNRVHYT